MNITIHYPVTLFFQFLAHMQQGLMTGAGPEASGEKTVFEEGKAFFNVLDPHQIDGVAVDHGSTSCCFFAHDGHQPLAWLTRSFSAWFMTLNFNIFSPLRVHFDTCRRRFIWPCWRRIGQSVLLALSALPPIFGVLVHQVR
jgi:hypothetical protein